MPFPPTASLLFPNHQDIWMGNSEESLHESEMWSPVIKLTTTVAQPQICDPLSLCPGDCSPFSSLELRHSFPNTTWIPASLCQTFINRILSQHSLLVTSRKEERQESFPAFALSNLDTNPRLFLFNKLLIFTSENNIEPRFLLCPDQKRGATHGFPGPLGAKAQWWALAGHR